MKNKVNDIVLVIPAPNGMTFGPEKTINGVVINPDQKGINYDLKVIEVDVLYKESDGLAVKIIDTLSRDIFELEDPTFSDPNVEPGTPRGAFLEYNYQSRKPYKTLPEKDTIRVYDKTPIRAATQEVSGNRLIYGNFVNKHTPPEYIDYNLIVDEKTNPVIHTHSPHNNTIQYPNHTVKQNRSYQVGIVLSDRYGRQSTVILSSVDDGETLGSLLYAGSTVFHPYRALSPNIITPSGLDPNYSWPGDSIQVLFNNIISSNKNNATGHPGLYDAETNPLGWYSWKVVVKQQEQDYYNIYFPGILNGTVKNGQPYLASAKEPICHITLHGDNINKVPRDLKNVGPDQKIFRTSKPSKKENPLWYNVIGELESGDLGEVSADFEDWDSLEARNFILQRNIELGLTEPDESANASLEMYCRVENIANTHTGHENSQYYPGRVSDTVINIGTGVDMGLWEASSFPSYIYNSQSNPLVARLETQDFDLGMGAVGSLLDPVIESENKLPILAVYETQPEISRLRLFWETSTNGLITSLNEAVEDSFAFIVDHAEWDCGGPFFDFPESKNPFDYNQISEDDARVSQYFHVVNSNNITIQPAYMQLISVSQNTISGLPVYVLGKFEVKMFDPPPGGPCASPPAGWVPLPPSHPSLYHAYIYCTDPVWYSQNSNHNNYTFNIIVTSNGVSHFLQLQGETRNIIPFGGYQPDLRLINGIPPSSGQVATEFYDGTAGGNEDAPGPGDGIPNTWVHDGFPHLQGLSTIGTPSDRDIAIRDTPMENHILADQSWIKLPVANGSWINGTNAVNILQWGSDNYPRISSELKISIIDQYRQRWIPTTNTFGPPYYNDPSDHSSGHFYITDYTNPTVPPYPYAYLRSDFSQVSADEFIDEDIFVITIKWEDCVPGTTGLPTANSLSIEKTFYCKIRTNIEIDTPYWVIPQGVVCHPNTLLPPTAIMLNIAGGDGTTPNNETNWQGLLQGPSNGSMTWNRAIGRVGMTNEKKDWFDEVQDNGVWTVGRTGNYDITFSVRMQLGQITIPYMNGSWHEWIKVTGAVWGSIHLYKGPTSYNYNWQNSGNEIGPNQSAPILSGLTEIPGAYKGFAIVYNQEQNYGHNSAPWNGTPPYGVLSLQWSGGNGSNSSRPGCSWTWDGDANTTSYPQPVGSTNMNNWSSPVYDWQHGVAANSNRNEYFSHQGTGLISPNGTSMAPTLAAKRIDLSGCQLNDNTSLTNGAGNKNNEWTITLTNVPLIANQKVFPVIRAEYWPAFHTGWMPPHRDNSGYESWGWVNFEQKGSNDPNYSGGSAVLRLISGSLKANTVY